MYIMRASQHGVLDDHQSASAEARRLDGQGLQRVAALRVGMDAKTARKYRRLGKLPSES